MSFVLLGILNAQAAGGAAGAPGDYDLLESEILTGTQASVSFSSLNSTYASTYQHLQLRIVARTNVAGNSDTLQLNFNSDTGSNYAFQRMYTDGSSGASTGLGSQTYINAGVLSGDTSTSGAFTPVLLDILNPFETDQATTTRSISGQTSVAFIFFNGGLWNNSAAVDSLVLDGLSGSFVSGSRFSLYGYRKVAV